MANYESKIEDSPYQPNDDEAKLKFYLAAYRKADTYNAKLRTRVVENRLFYDGVDDMLEQRRNDPDVTRSSLFIHELRPAIDTREAAFLDRIDEDLVPVRLKVQDEYDLKDYPYETEEEITEMVPKLEEELNRQMRDCGYLTRILMEQFHGAELQPISFIKVGIEEKKGNIPRFRRIKPDMTKLAVHLIKYRSLPPPEYTTEYEYGTVSYNIYTDFRDWDEILYDPEVINESQLRYIIDRQWLTWNELVAKCEDLEINPKILDDLKVDEGGENEEVEPKVSEEIKEEEDDDWIVGYKNGKYLFCEMWFKHFENGRLTYRTMYVVKNKKILKDMLSPYPGISFPFNSMVAHPKLGSLEGDSSIDVGKTLQRVYSDLINCLMDLYTYGIIPVLIGRKAATTMGRQPVWKPGEVIQCDDPGGLVPLQINVAAAQYLIPVIELMSSKIKQVLGAADVDQGINQPGAEDEKATKTRLRAQGAARRSRSFMKRVADNIIKVAEMFISLNQQNDPLWIVPVEIDIPCLSGVYTPDEELMKAQAIYDMALKSPLYQMPEGLKKLKQLFEDVLVKSRVKDIDARLITDEELDAYIAFAKEAQKITGDAIAQKKEAQNVA